MLTESREIGYYLATMAEHRTAVAKAYRSLIIAMPYLLVFLTLLVALVAMR